MADSRRHHTNQRMSQIVEYPANGTIVVLAGQVAEDRTADTKGQTADVLRRIDKLLADAGTDKTRIVSANIWLTDISEFAQMNEVWDAWVPQGHAPARATVESKLAHPALRVEIQVVAVK
jgi:enamine deaminase RidA (YjgF/YER057c/UK114 family)